MTKNERTRLAWVAPAVLAIAGLAPWPAEAADRPAEFVPDLLTQFAELNVRADPLGLNISTTPNPSSCKHYQAITRMQGLDDTPFFIMTRSGNTPSLGGPIPDDWLCDDSPGETGNGHLVVFRMDSRDKHGERMRSNRLRKGANVSDTLPDARDVATKYYTTTETGLVFRDGTAEVPVERVYDHPGGMQAIGNVLAVVLEKPRSSASPDSLVLFLDMANPESPSLLSTYAPRTVTDQSIVDAGTMGIARMPDGHFLMAITGGANNTVVHFFRSTLTDLESPSLDWTPLDAWVANTYSNALFDGICPLAIPGSIVGPNQYCRSPDEQYLEQNWPDGNEYFTHQTLNFLRDGDINGTLYLAGARGRFMAADTSIDLYRVDCDTVNCDSGDVRLKRISSRDMQPYPIGGGEKLASFAAATGYYASPSGELLLYGAEHDNDGPGETVKAGEWRNRNVVRDGSPTLKPTASITAPLSIDEGSSAALSGTARGPLTKAFLQLFHGTSFGSYSLIADYADRDSDDFQVLELYEFQILGASVFQHHDKARSWIWHAPYGCTVRATDRVQADVIKVSTLMEGPTEEPTTHPAANLATIMSDDGSGSMDANINGVDFLPNCDTYYSTPFQLAWDLDADGTFDDGTSSSATFSAANRDGPGVVVVRAQSRSPLGGPSGVTAATIMVNNVAPTVDSFEVRDSLGLRIGIDVPFALLGLPLSAHATFTDPGRLDNQTATLDWGDGSLEPSSAFDTFVDALGGRQGSLSRAHRYAASGDYPLQLKIRDDDAGVAQVDGFVSVLSPAEALQELIVTLEEKIAATTNPTIRRALELARQQLLGAVSGVSSNGAVGKLSADQVQSALKKIRNAISQLQTAQSAGANVSAEIALLQQLLVALRAA